MDVFIRVSVGPKGLIGVVFVVGAGGLITDLLTIQWRFLLNNVNVIKANMFINYTVGTTNQFGAVFKGVGIIKGQINFIKIGDCSLYKVS